MSDFDPILRARSAYKFWQKDHVRFNDLDALGHFGSARAQEFFTDVRARLFHDAMPGWPNVTRLPVLRASSTSHEKEAHFRATLETGLVIEKFGRTSLSFVMGIFQGEDCIALSRNVFVFIDSTTRKSTEPGAEIVAAFMKLAGA